MNDLERRNRPLFPMSIIMELTDLSARQIRYYEENDLIIPARTNGGHRLFSFSDIDRLLEIKDLLEKKVNLAGIKEIFNIRDSEQIKHNVIKNKIESIPVTDTYLRKKIAQELLHQKPNQINTLIQGDLSRFFH
ncbi:MAG: MerR family transcriptional regulator [Vulcanibacillus sp.]